MSSIVSEVLPTRTLRTREVATYALVTNRPTAAKQRARRVRDVLQGRQLDVVAMHTPMPKRSCLADVGMHIRAIVSLTPSKRL
jgi:hypothetical protein